MQEDSVQVPPVQRRRVADLTSAMIISVFLAFTLFILPGFSIYAFNRQNFFGATFEVLELSFYVAASAAFICTLIAMLVPQRYSRSILVVFLGLGLFSWVKSQFLIGELPLIDGAMFVVSWQTKIVLLY